MKRFKKILYYSDGINDDQPSFERAVELALINNARLTLAGVLTRLPRDLQMLLPVTPPAELTDLAIKEVRMHLDRLSGKFLGEKISVNIEVFCGTPFLEIIRAVMSAGYDLVMMTAEGNGKDRKLFGSTSLRLMRKCPCPVWVIKPGPHRRFERILAAVDPNPNDEEHKGINNRIMELAVSIARQEHSDLRIVHAWNLFGEEAMRHWHKHMKKDDINGIVSENETMHEKWLNDLVSDFDLTGIPHNISMIKGEPAEVITDHAAAHRVDLIIMGTVGRIGIPGFIIGNTAESVLGSAQCSVLTVKPDGFVSPVLNASG